MTFIVALSLLVVLSHTVFGYAPCVEYCKSQSGRAFGKCNSNCNRNTRQICMRWCKNKDYTGQELQDCEKDCVLFRSCRGYCGGPTPNSVCWCDTACVSIGDCCPNYSYECK